MYQWVWRTPQRLKPQECCRAWLHLQTSINKQCRPLSSTNNSCAPTTGQRGDADTHRSILLQCTIMMQRGFGPLLLCMFCTYHVFSPFLLCCNASAFVICVIKNYLLTFLHNDLMLAPADPEIFFLDACCFPSFISHKQPLFNPLTREFPSISIPNLNLYLIQNTK